jgi:hypothetical protein
MIDINSLKDTEIVDSATKYIKVEYQIITGYYNRIRYRVNNELLPSSFHGTLDELEEELLNKYKSIFPLNNIKLIGVNLTNKN